MEIAPWEWAVLEVNVGHPIVTNGDLLRSCVKMRDVIELPFGVVSVVDSGIGVYHIVLYHMYGMVCRNDRY